MELRTETPIGSSATTSPHIISSADELLLKWAARDEVYSQRLTPLTASESAAIRSQREQESRYVEPRRRGPLFVKARAWRAPKLKEWA